MCPKECGFSGMNNLVNSSFSFNLVLVCLPPNPHRIHRKRVYWILSQGSLGSRLPVQAGAVPLLLGETGSVLADCANTHNCASR